MKAKSQGEKIKVGLCPVLLIQWLQERLLTMPLCTRWYIQGHSVFEGEANNLLVSNR